VRLLLPEQAQKRPKRPLGKANRGQSGLSFPEFSIVLFNALADTNALPEKGNFSTFP
jgi:hypothetical protein